jgi:hypothetical protein
MTVQVGMGMKTDGLWGQRRLSRARECVRDYFRDSCERFGGFSALYR